MSKRIWILLALLLCLFPGAGLASMKEYALLTSGSADEAAQKSDQIGSSTPASLARIGGLSVAKRHRIQLGVGFWDAGEPREISPACSARLNTNIHDLLLNLSYAYWLREELAATVSFRALIVEARATTGPANDCESGAVVGSTMLGLRTYPFATPQATLRPFLAAAAGPYLGVESTWGVGPDSIKETRTQGSFGGYLGGGLDVQIGRYFMVDFNAGYNLMKDFSEPLGDKRNYNGFECGIGLSVLFGKGI